MTALATPNTTDESNVASLDAPSRSLWADAWIRLRRNKAAVVGMFIIGFFVIVALFAPLIAPHNPLQIHDGMSYLPPAWVDESSTGRVGDPRFLLGTDTIGRDVLSRVIYGSRVSLVVGLAPVVVILLVGVLVGLISGFTGGRTDNLMMRITDIFYAFPALLLYIIMMVTLRDTPLGRVWNGMLLLFLALAIVSWVGVARLVRGSVLALKEKEFVEAAKSIGSTDGRIM